MVIGVGTDIIEISRIKKACLNKSFLNRVYTFNELALFNKKNYHTLAGNFAAKESVAKALGTGFRAFSPADIEILRDDMGCPYAILYNNALNISRDLNIDKIHLTISHSIEFAVAYAVAEGGI